MSDLAHVAALQALAHVGVPGAESPLKADHHMPAEGLGVIGDLLSQFGRVRQGLFAQHVRAGVQSAHDMLVMQRMGCSNQRRVQVGGCQKFTPVPVGRDVVKAFHPRAHARDGRVGGIGHANNLNLGHREESLQVTRGHAANANGAQSVWHRHRALCTDGRKSTSRRQAEARPKA